MPIENKDPNNRARGYQARFMVNSNSYFLFFNTYHNAHKAAMKNPRVSEEAKKHAQQKLSEIKSQGHTSEESEAEARSTRYRESQQQNVANQEVAGEAVGEEEEEEPEMVEGEEGEVSEEEE